MPSSLLSHQGIVLPLKIKYPDKFDGTALCVGSFAPDLAFFTNSFATQLHSLDGLVYTVPISLILVIFFDTVLLPSLAFLAAKRQLGAISRFLAYFGVDDLDILREKKYSIKWIVKATYSVLIGIFTHFLLDLPTHAWVPYLRPFYNCVMPEWFLQEYFFIEVPLFRSIKVTNYNILWFLSSMLFGIIALYYLRYIKKHHLLQRWYKKRTPITGFEI